MRYKIIRKGISSDGGHWAVLQKIDGNRKFHLALFTTGDIGKEDEIGFSDEFNEQNTWELSGSLDKKIFENQELNNSNKSGFNIDSILNFGLYKGYQVGIVYAFDIKYIEWCIINIKNFHLNNLDTLQEIGVFNGKKEYSQSRDYGVLGLDPMMDEYKSIFDLAREVPVLNSEIRLPEEIYNLNEEKRLRQAI